MRMSRNELREKSSTIDNLMDIGKIEEAEQLLQEMLAASEHDPAYNLFFQAEASLYINKDHRERERLLSDSLKLAPDDAFIMRNLGGGYLLDEKYGRARRMLYKALELEPESADTKRSIGLLYSAKGLESRAISWFQKAVAAKPDDNDSLRQVGVCYSKLGNDEEAINWYRRALACSSQDYDAMRQIGVSHAMLGDYDIAIDWLKNAIEINPADRDSRRNLHLVEQKKSGQGITFLDRLMVKVARRMTLIWRRLVDRLDQMKKE